MVSTDECQAAIQHKLEVTPLRTVFHADSSVCFRGAAATEGIRSSQVPSVAAGLWLEQESQRKLDLALTESGGDRAEAG